MGSIFNRRSLSRFASVPALALVLFISQAAAQPGNVLILGDPSDTMLPARPESKGVMASAAGDLYVLVQRNGSVRQLGIWKSTDQGATWAMAGQVLGQGGKGSMVFDSTGVILNVLYSENSMTLSRVAFNRFDTSTSTWLQPADTLVFSGSGHYTADDIERTADDRLLVIAETYQASPSQGLYYRFWNGTAWQPDPVVDLDGVRIDQTYTSGIHASIVVDRALPAASSVALIYYRSGTGSYGRIETRINLGTLAIGPELALHGEGGAFVAGTANDRTANLQSVLRVDTGEIYMAFTANNSANSLPRVRLGRRDLAGAWTFFDVSTASNYQHGNADFNDVVVGMVDGQVAVYYGKNTYTGALSAQNGQGVFRKIWDPLTATFGGEVMLPVVNQNGTLGFVATARESLPGLHEFVVYRDNSTSNDVYCYRDPVALSILTVTSPAASVYPGQSGVPVDVEIENAGVQAINLVSVMLDFTDASAVDRTGEYTVFPDPTNPASIAGGATETLSFLVDVDLGATPGDITVDATVAAIDPISMVAIVDQEADTPHVWNVPLCGVALCGDCNGDLIVSILDALLAAQISAGLIAVPPFGSPQFNACNVQGVVYPGPTADIAILDALELARFAAALTTLSCC